MKLIKPNWKGLITLIALYCLAGPTHAALLALLSHPTSGPSTLSTINTSQPTTLLSPTVTVTGLQPGEVLSAIDFRPATGQLYGLGDMNRLYVINLETGVATPVGTAPFTPVLGDFRVGFDFDPVTDQIRVVSATGQNLRLDPNTGAGIAIDSPLTDASSPGTSVSLLGLAYSNNGAGMATTAYGVDAFGAIYRLGSVNGSPDSPNSGRSQLLGQLPVTLIGGSGANLTSAGFDIAATGETYAATYSVGGMFGSIHVIELFEVNLTNSTGTSLGGLPTSISGLAVIPNPTAANLQFNSATYSVNEGAGSSLITVTRTGLTTSAVKVNYATSNGTAVSPSDYTPASSTLSFAAGETSKTFSVPITDDTAAEPSETINLSLSSPTGLAVLGSPGTAVLTIADDDSSGGGGGGCTLNPRGKPDATLPLLLVMAMLYLLRRRFIRTS